MAVDPGTVRELLDAGRVPVVATVARGADGLSYNVNADTAAAALAAALGAEKLVILTDVAGLYADWPASDEVVSQLTVSEVEDLLPSLMAGMIPKMQACLDAVRGGVTRAHLLDGRVAHALLVEVFTSDGIGTMVVPDGEAKAIDVDPVPIEIDYGTVYDHTDTDTERSVTT